MQRVLIVDDSESVRVSLRAILERAGFEVLESADGLEALELLQGESEIDMILLDINMPAMNGLEFAREQSKNEKFADHFNFSHN